MSIAVQGSGGFIGTNLCKRKHFLAKKPTMSEAIFSNIAVDLRALSGIAKCAASPVEAFDVNVHRCLRTMWLCQDAGIPYVFASSMACERDPTSVYAATKLAMEAFIRAAHANGRRCYAIRFANVYGPHSVHKESVVHRFIRQHLVGTPLTIHGDGTQEREYVYVERICDDIERVIYKGGPAVQRCSPGRVASVNEVAEWVKDPKGSNAPEGIQETIDWYRENWTCVR